MADRSWWSSRFLALIEGMSPPEPLRAGRALARTEAVLSVRRSGNLVVAMVRDQREDLHKTRLAVRTFGDTDWGRIERALASQARYAAALLAGSMPPDIEDAFALLGLSLLPTRADDLAMDCTCADWQRPCAHLVAACHRLGESMDLDAFALLALRGRERDALLTGIRRLRPASASSSGGAQPYVWSGGWPQVAAGQPGGGTTDETGEPLPSSPSAFWSAPVSAGGSGVRSEDHGPARPDILLDLCGPLVVEPLGDLREELRPAYRVFAGRRGSAPRPDGAVEE